MSSAVINLLAQQSTARLRETQAEVREQIESLRRDDDLIAQALAQKAQKTQKAKPERRHPEQNGSAPSQRLDSGAPGERREVYREILSTQSGRPQTVAEIVAAVSARQIESNPPAVRAMLRRMMDDGEVERVDHKHWKLAYPTAPSATGLPQAQPAGAAAP
jgi:hypothetical protein